MMKLAFSQYTWLSLTENFHCFRGLEVRMLEDSKVQQARREGLMLRREGYLAHAFSSWNTREKAVQATLLLSELGDLG